MENFEYNEEILEKSGLNLQLGKEILLIDLLRIEYFKEIRHEFAINYLSELSKNSKFQVSSTLEDLAPMKIVLLSDWSLFVYLSEIYCISTQTGRLSICRANLNTLTQLKNTQVRINTVEICQESGFSYMAINLCKFFLQSFLNIEDLLSIDKLDTFKQDARVDMASFIYSSSHLSAKNLLFKLNEAKELMQVTDFEYEEYVEEVPLSCTVYYLEQKPVCDLLINNSSYSSLESLEYTQSEDTGKLETSFRLSNTITGRFPRLSGSSIAVMETPSKETKKSYTEYIECMESPRFSSINPSPIKAFISTPIFSPKQNVYSIQQVRDIMMADGEFQSPCGKESSRRVRGGGVKPLSFQDTDTKSLNSNLCISSREFGKTKTVFEEQKISCRCQSCSIF